MPTTDINLSDIKAPVSNLPLTPEEFAAGKDCVTMQFNKAVVLTIDWGTRVSYPTGPHEVPRDIANHWFLKAHDAYVYNKPVAVAAPKPQATAKV